MSFSIGGNPINGIIVNSIESGKTKAEQVVTEQIKEVLNDPAKNTRQMQQPSGLSTFLDIKV